MRLSVGPTAHCAATGRADSGRSTSELLPAEVTLRRSQEGEVLALITMADGDRRTLALPEEIDGPEQAFRYLLSERLPPEVQAGIGSMPWT